MSFRLRSLVCLLAASFTLPAAAATATLTLVSTVPTSFPATAVGATSVAQKVQFTFATAFALTSIAVPQSINTTQEFTIGAISGCATDGVTVNAVGTTCSVSITFTPAYPGARHQPLVVTAASGQTYAFGLTGTATGSLSVRYPGIGSTNAGGVAAAYTYSGDGGPALNAGIDYPYGIAIDNTHNEYFVDYNTSNVRVIYQGNGSDSLACLIQIAQPSLFGLAANTTTCAGATSKPVAGDMYTLAGSQIPFSTSVTTHTTGASGDGGVVNQAKIATPVSVAVDAAGNIFFGDYTNYTIRVIYVGGPQVACLIQVENPASFGLSTGSTSCAAATSQPAFGSIWTLVGESGAPVVGPSGDGGLATNARIVYPYGLAVSPAGDIFFTDNSTNTARNARIRVIYAGGANAASLITLENPTVTTPTFGYVYRLAGNTTLATDSGDATSLASSAGMLYARSLVLDPNGNLFFPEYDIYTTPSSNPAHKVRAIYLQGAAVANLLSLENSGVTPQPGYIYDVAGINGTSSKGYSGDGGLASAAQLNQPFGLALDPAGNLYIGDTYNYRIRKVNIADGIITTAFGNGVHSGASSNEVFYPYGMAIGSDGTLFFSEYADYRLREVSIGAYPLTFASAAAPQNVGGNTIVATATSYSIAANVATVVAPNSLLAGASVNLAAFTSATFFNGNTYTVLSATSTQFTFNYNNGSTAVPSTADTGTVTYTSLPQSIVEANIGNATLNMLGNSAPLNWSLAVPSVAGVRACVNSSDSLAAGAQCAVAAQFYPLIAGSPLTGNLTILDTALNTASTTHAVGLTGYSTGTAAAILQLTASNFTATPTQTITLTATITGAAGTPTQTVTFQDLTLGAPVCTATLVAVASPVYTATASCPAATFSLGQHQIQATYNGDPNFNSTTSNTITLAVALLTPTIRLGSSAVSPNLGAPETFTATLGGSLASPPTGTVTFTYANATLGSVQTLAAGVASIVTSVLPAGNDCVTANYSGDSNFAPISTSVCINVVPPSYTMSSTVTGIAVANGGNTPVPLTITTVGGYSKSITGSCSALPAGAACLFIPASYQANGVNGAYTWSVTVVGPVRSASLARNLGAFSAALLFPLSLLRVTRRRRRRWSQGMLLIALGAALGTFMGCGSATVGGTNQTVNINVNATDGTLTQSFPLTVTISGVASH